MLVEVCAQYRAEVLDRLRRDRPSWPPPTLSYEPNDSNYDQNLNYKVQEMAQIQTV